MSFSFEAQGGQSAGVSWLLLTFHSFKEPVYVVKAEDSVLLLEDDFSHPDKMYHRGE